MGTITHHEGGGVTFAGADAIEIYRATAIASGLRLYARTGMKPNRAYTSTAMIAAANEITGHVYRRGQYLMAAQALTEWAQRARAALDGSR